MAISQKPASCCCCGGNGSKSGGASKHTEVIIDLVIGVDPRSTAFMPGWDLETARQKLLFFSTPKQFIASCAEILPVLDDFYATADGALRKRFIGFLLHIVDSLNSKVELSHNLQNEILHGGAILSDADAKRVQDDAEAILLNWEKIDQSAAQSVLLEIKSEDIAVNKGDNLFIAWAKDWQKKNGRDPYNSIADFLMCFKTLYAPDTYYVSLYLAWRDGKTSTQFFNDYGLQAARCRKIGSLGGTTNPAIAVMGEDDLDGKANMWGEEATAFIKKTPNKWTQIRRVIAQEQVKKSEADDWGATAFTEWVVVDAMLGLRSIFLLEGLGRVAFQLRPDWHDKEELLTRAGGRIHKILCARMSQFDDILLDGAAEPYQSVTACRAGKSNNHFKIACTSQAALNVVRAFNAGHHPKFPDALEERMFTNVTLSYEVPQMVAASLATENGIKDYEARTGEKTDDGRGGSVVTSMIGRFNDAIRLYRVESMLNALPAGSPSRTSIKPAAIKTLADPALTSDEFRNAVKAVGIDFDPKTEEDAINHAGTLLTKRTALILTSKYGLPKSRLLTASKRNFNQNTDLLNVPFSTDFGNIQRMYLDLHNSGGVKIDSWNTLVEEMNPDGTPKAGSIWEKRNQILRRIWPDWAKAYEVEGVAPDQYMSTIYVPPTLTQFIGLWEENVARAKAARESLSA
ncbi:MAG: hypothetical protein Q7N50_04940 [Armatimonadota bacterium]|nr:hypothetical protein [Armatimonadota bacterium]